MKTFRPHSSRESMPARSNISWWSSQKEITTKNLLLLLKHDAAEVFLIHKNESCLCQNGSSFIDFWFCCHKFSSIKGRLYLRSSHESVPCGRLTKLAGKSIVWRCIFDDWKGHVPLPCSLNKWSATWKWGCTIIEHSTSKGVLFFSFYNTFG